MTETGALTRPPGIIRVAIINTAFALIAGGIAWMRYSEGHTNIIALVATVVFILIGPALLIRAAWTWRAARPLAYVFAMGLSLLIVYAALDGQLMDAWLFYLLLIPIVIYLIGLRGYLATEHVCRWFGVPVPASVERKRRG